MPMSFDTRFLIARLQTARDVAAEYGGANLLPALELNHRPLEADRQTRDILDGSPGGAGKDFLARPRVRVTAALEAAAGVAPGTAPFWGEIAQACGLAETVEAGISASYSPGSDANAKWATLVGGFGGTQGAPGTADDFLQEAINATGTIGFQARDGELPRLDLDLTAIYGAPVARGAIAAASPLDIGPLGQAAYREVDPVSYANSAFSFAGETLVLRELTMQDETPVIYSDRPNDLSTRRGRRRYTGRMVVTAPALGSFDYFARSLDGTEQALLFSNGPLGNRFEFRADRVQAFLSDLGEQDNDVIATFDLLYLHHDTTGNFRITAK
ncbi:hypothetical protein SAMN05443999_101255 [Roseovarius azorensis]|uniref:Uncharacterized protein n=1 Tax=Roseovarius azorensis TaxID=1287727 RepID=A0A1H7G8E0_9RHOB|nr:hypothetical protein [Roseovarius azorensis]SEK34553.1 hypothetical protein SAMN05443999_101255 [Roseovarius azorensis]